jgi:hypothetical protein
LLFIPWLTELIFKILRGDGNDTLSRYAVTNYQSMLHNIPEERRFHLHTGGDDSDSESVGRIQLAQDRVEW